MLGRAHEHDPPLGAGLCRAEERGSQHLQTVCQVLENPPRIFHMVFSQFFNLINKENIEEQEQSFTLFSIKPNVQMLKKIKKKTLILLN